MINGCIELFAAVIIIVLLVSMEPEKTDAIIEKRLIAMISCHLFVLILDATRWFLIGFTSIGWLQLFLSVAPTILALIVHTNFILFALEYLTQKGPIPRKANLLFAGFFIVAIAVWASFILSNGVTSAANVQTNYDFMKHSWVYWLGHLSWGGACVLGIWIVLRCRQGLSNAELLSMISYCAFPLIALVLRFFFDGAQIFLATFLSLVWISAVAYREQRQRLNEKETQLAQSRIAIVLSRIQPEFFDKVLAIICSLCDEDSVKAKNLTQQFATFLRYNIEAVSQSTPTVFNAELQHTKCYISIQQNCFKDKLKVFYNIKTEKFMIPSLTVQPLVENAIAAMLQNWQSGCKIDISTNESNYFYEVEIKHYPLDLNVDMQMLTNELLYNSENIKERLWMMCKGTLDVLNKNSYITALICIPKPKANAKQHKLS